MKYYSLILIVFLFSCSYKSRCIRCIDGDTFVIESGERVRICFIYCPEATGTHLQPFGREATQFTRKYLEGQEVTLKSKGRDKFHRLLSEVWLPDGRYFERLLIDSGMCYVYPKYAPKYLYDLELKAKENKIGLWSYKNISPYQFRRNERRN